MKHFRLLDCNQVFREQRIILYFMFFANLSIFLPEETDVTQFCRFS